MTKLLEKLEQQASSFARKYLEGEGHHQDQYHLEPMATDGSTRLFWRIHLEATGESLVIMANPPTTDFLRAENQAYLLIGQHLREKGISVPKILARNFLRGLFIMTDLGDQHLQSVVKQGEDPVSIYETVLEELIRLHLEARSGFDPQWCCQTPKYDTYVMRTYESDYFKKAFLIDYLGLKRDWSILTPDFDYLAQKASQAKADYVIHRDIQSRNILIKKGKIGFVDWQGARLGPPAYDLASLLIDPYVDLNESTAQELFDQYVKAMESLDHPLAEDLKRYYHYIAIQRNLQILGAFAFLTKERGKSTFSQYIGPSVARLYELLEKLGDTQLANLQGLAVELHEQFRKELVSKQTTT